MSSKGLVLGSNPLTGIFFLLLKRISFVRTDGQTDIQTDNQTDRQIDKHPQSCCENMPFGKPLKRLPPRKYWEMNPHFFIQKILLNLKNKCLYTYLHQNILTKKRIPNNVILEISLEINLNEKSKLLILAKIQLFQSKGAMIVCKQKKKKSCMIY